MVHNASDKTVLRESIETSEGDAFAIFDGTSHLSNIGSGMPGHVGKDNPVPTVVRLQKIPSEQPSSTRAQTQSSRYAPKISMRLGQGSIQRTEGEQEGAWNPDEQRNP
ncbi:hypothetical protein [Streptomyces sp. NPDC056632]|uniref:hypothetical protein n=1 Tax=Streptomyces sp. NPDC056632 TaxID=3345884 RepID=UPI00368AF4A3